MGQARAAPAQADLAQILVTMADSEALSRPSLVSLAVLVVHKLLLSLEDRRLEARRLEARHLEGHLLEARLLVVPKVHLQVARPPEAHHRADHLEAHHLVDHLEAPRPAARLLAARILGVPAQGDLLAARHPEVLQVAPLVALHQDPAHLAALAQVAPAAQRKGHLLEAPLAAGHLVALATCSPSLLEDLPSASPTPQFKLQRTLEEMPSRQTYPP